MSRIELRTSREIPVAASAVEAVANCPATYPKWVAALRSLEERGGATYTACVGYLSCQRTINCEWTRQDAHAMVWEGEDDALRARLELTIAAIGDQWSAVQFGGYIEGNPLPGLVPNDEIAGLLINGAAEYSLARLEKLASELAQYTQRRMKNGPRPQSANQRMRGVPRMRRPAVSASKG